MSDDGWAITIAIVGDVIAFAITAFGCWYRPTKRAKERP